MKILRNYRDTFLLLGGVVIGGVVGAVVGEKAIVLQPFGELFLNLMYMLLIPLIFFSIASAIGQMGNKARLGRILASTVGVFLFTALVATVIGYIGVRLFPLIQSGDLPKLKAMMGGVKGQNSHIPVLQQLVELFTVDDFSKLLSKSHMLATIVFSLLIGIATSASGQHGEAFRQFLGAGNAVVLKAVHYVMLYAPFGLACYFAGVVGTLGSQIVGGYLRSFLLYLGLTLVYFFGVMTLYAWLANGRSGVRAYWRHVSIPAITAIATSSSAACIPVNLQAAKAIGLAPDIVDTVIPLGANIHKDGSAIGGVFKVSFLFLLFGHDITSWSSILAIIAGGFFVGAVMGAVPVGGMIAETLIVTMFGYPTDAIPLLIVISTIIDVPATLLNSTGNIASSMMVARLVEGRHQRTLDQ
ncbi:dicarboxylate/amino acid:cation symporter [Lacticaseibacillus baoqingensis]|uniref:Dicarboxylate/amino acid:cation symporter n=1 Tax=Lacticaseibacillus baoqingensis TaxID=2486013 RepID=A0ABW4E529_9LACO|nr:dicarboxylate/amino acid:cation symporter [Lacticaseibacillus baoqingensis]